MLLVVSHNDCSKYSVYGHIKKLAEAEAEGIKGAGDSCDMYQIEETLPSNILQTLHAPPQDPGVPFVEDGKTLEDYDAFLFGIPTRYGNMPVQWKGFWDDTSPQRMSGAYWGKHAGLFVSTGGPGGGQESTALAMMSTLTHHGLVYVPLGYKPALALLGDMSEYTVAVRGELAPLPWVRPLLIADVVDSPLRGADGSRWPTENELAIARAQDKSFYEVVSKAHK